jgi:hypothetical protein
VNSCPLPAMRRHYANLLRQARARRKVAELTATTDPGESASAGQAAAEYAHAAAEILEDIRWQEDFSDRTGAW